jgi:uncharacterized YccA/Bax inhibitor family protein
MESRNPVFGRDKAFARGGYATFDTSASTLNDMYQAPAATATDRDTGRMSIDDVVIRTASLFATLLVTGAITFELISPQNFGLVIVAAIVGLVLSLVVSFSKTIRPVLMFAYAAVEGVFVGGISLAFNTAYPNIVIQAVLGTVAAFGAMLALYSFKVIRVTPKFQRVLIIAGVGYLVFALLNLLLSSLNVIPSVYSVGGLGLLVSAFGVGLAALYLVLDFDFINQGIANGLPRQYAWTAAFGLVTTLVWLYVEVLRLLAILRGNN